MENNETFQMTYSAKQQQEIEKIRKKYLPVQEDKMAQLRALDARAGKKASVAAIAVGVVGTLMLGIGMSLAISDFGAKFGTLALPIGACIGVVGIAVLALAYPLYVRKLKAERARIAPEILRLSEELMN